MANAPLCPSAASKISGIADWLAQLETAAPGSLLYLSGYQLASPCGELLVQWLEGLQDVTPFIDFGPRIGDIPGCPYWRGLWPVDLLVSLNRQEAEIAAERFALSAEIYNILAQQWQEQRFAAPLIVRLDKEGAWYFSTRRFRLHTGISDSRSLTPLARATATPAACWPGWPLVWPLADAVLLGNAVASVGGRASRAAIVRLRARRYSSHTNTYRSLRQ